MIMATGEGKFTCSVCKQLFKNPVVHKICGFSFHRECLGNRCPEQECQQVIKEEDLILNHCLSNVVEEYRSTLVPHSAYYMILLDNSTSMWYSDTWFPLILGESRGGNVNEFVNSLTNTLTTKARSRVQPTKNIAEQLIDQLPTVPNTSIKVRRRQPDFA
ncbi:unnamed protein product [Adineta steineri]|uniref:Zinc finger RING-type eukaryotic domain-containing protein n=1 Tax=Adineta steineri TaxID=433720 RepID=A0A816FBE1_9BILA|nr:unnamed protein product [Adineta steineri]CAF1659241.1 unnamed protein product [Adineta steineri]